MVLTALRIRQAARVLFGRRPTQLVLRPADFRDALMRARSLHERYGLSHAVITLPASWGASVSRLESLASMLRDIDAMGVLQDGRVAVLLGGADEREVRGFLASFEERTGCVLPADHRISYPTAAPLDDEHVAKMLTAPIGPVRRAIDVAVSGAALLLLSPLFALVALAVKLDSRGPVFYAQDRVGEAGRAFRFFKFRSMSTSADAVRDELADDNQHTGPIFKIRADPRITRVGRVIRRLSLDELPQLWNVLKGDMTLIGPRPPLSAEVAEYEPWQERRLLMRGGLTCIWQVSGRSDIGFIDWVRMDLRYDRARSLMLDAWIVSRTFGAVVSGRGAY